MIFFVIGAIVATDATVAIDTSIDIDGITVTDTTAGIDSVVVISIVTWKYCIPCPYSKGRIRLEIMV